jgi:hypothetical protein
MERDAVGMLVVEHIGFTQSSNFYIWVDGAKGDRIGGGNEKRKEPEMRMRKLGRKLRETTEHPLCQGRTPS